jgi:hypothetical protein
MVVKIHKRLSACLGLPTISGICSVQKLVAENFLGMLSEDNDICGLCLFVFLSTTD